MASSDAIEDKCERGTDGEGVEGERKDIQNHKAYY